MHSWRLTIDIILLVISAAIAVLLAESGVVESVLSISAEFDLLASLLAGLFFTSVFTTAPAIVMLGELSQVQSLWTTAALGAIGATIGDLVIFSIAKHRLADDMVELWNRLRHHRPSFFRHLRVGSWWVRVIGAAIIGSPLPDEIGLTLLGVTKTRWEWFIPLALTVNFLGIALIGLAARS